MPDSLSIGLPIILCLVLLGLLLVNTGGTKKPAIAATNVDRCPKCGEAAAIGASECWACDTPFGAAPPLAATRVQAVPVTGGSLRVAGGTSLAIGALVMLYFFLGYDTSVRVDAAAIGIDRVNNLGLMMDRLCGEVVGGVLMVVGAIWVKD